MPFSSKFRHVYGEVPKTEGMFCDVKKPYTSGEGRYAAANAKFWASSKASGGGPMYVCRHDDPGRKTMGKDLFCVNVQKGKALDFDFHPFIPNLIGSVSEDTSVCVTEFPEEGLTADVKTAACTMKGHQKKTHLMKWHPTANNIIVSASWDKAVKLWNVETQDCVQTYEGLPGVALSMAWNKDGSLLAMTEKGKKQLVTYDPRSGKESMQFQCADSTKSTKVFWVPTYNWIGVTAFTKQAKRCLKIWDLNKIDKPIYNEVVDQQSSVLMPFYDEETHILFMHGKGEGSVQFSELVNDKRIYYNLGMYRDTTPQKGGCFVPKRAMRVFDCEVARYIKVTRDSVIPVSFRVPRKAGAEIFQEDIYPDCAAGLPSMTADEYLGGDNKDPITKSMDPEKNQGDGATAVKFVKKQTYAELSKENEELKATIAALEKQLADLQGE